MSLTELFDELERVKAENAKLKKAIEDALHQLAKEDFWAMVVILQQALEGESDG